VWLILTLASPEYSKEKGGLMDSEERKEPILVPTATRAKFKCQSIERYFTYDGKETHNAKFGVVPGDSEENRRFFMSTPSGKIEVTTVQPDVFKLGQNYYVDFIPAD
jgi:hypothetical protein